MKDTFDRAVHLGFGLAATGKEQIERTIDELVKKGEMSRAESGTWREELIRKGEEARERTEELIRDRVNALMGDKRLATVEDLMRLEKRVDELERRLETES